MRPLAESDTFIESESEKGRRDSRMKKVSASEKVRFDCANVDTLDVVGVGFPATVLDRIVVVVMLRKLHLA